MAELNINDVNRAVSDGNRELVNQVQRIQQQLQQMGNVQQAVQQIALLQQQMTDCVRQLQNINNQMVKMQQQSTASGGNSSSSSAATTAIRSDIRELKLRFAVFERFAEGVSDYLRAEFEQRQQGSRG